MRVLKTAPQHVVNVNKLSSPLCSEVELAYLLLLEQTASCVQTFLRECTLSFLGTRGTCLFYRDLVERYR